MNYDNLNQFITLIENFELLKPSEQIDFFIYYITVEENEPFASYKQIQSCFEYLHLVPYSNIHQHIRNNSVRKKLKYVKKENGVILHLAYQRGIENKIGVTRGIDTKYILFPRSIFEGTRGYIEKVAEQVTLCYEYTFYDASLVMLRKLIETLIIELYEARGLDTNIKGNDGHFMQFSNLISKLLSEPSWNISRNSVSAINKIKRFGDLSAHNRRFIAKKRDIDNISDDIRIVLQELVELIDYGSVS